MASIFIKKVGGVVARKVEALAGRLRPIGPVIDAMETWPYELHLELTNICNAKCVFCPYQFQERETGYMPDEVFHKAIADFVADGGGGVFFTPIVGDALIDKQFLVRVKHARAQPRVGHIKVITNAILVDRFGAKEIIESGLTEIAISTAGFDEEMYERVYQNKKYKAMRKNVLALLEENKRAGSPVQITIGLRPDLPVGQVMQFPDFQEILAYEPKLDFTWSFTSAGGRIQKEMLTKHMKLRVSPPKHEPCVSTLNGPVVLQDGTVLICSCVAAMDAVDDLAIGNVLESPLSTIWRSEKAKAIRRSFKSSELNPTCESCDMYRGLDLYRTRVGRERAADNLARRARID